MAARSIPQFIVELIDDPSCICNSSDRKNIVAHIAAAPFAKDPKTLDEHDPFGAPQLVGKPHPSQTGTLQKTTMLSSAEFHVLKHSYFDDSWAQGTSTQEYLDDVGTIVATCSQVDVGRTPVAQRMASRAATRTSAVPQGLKKAQSKVGEVFLVMYDPARKAIVTAFRLPSAGAEAKVAKFKPRRML